VLNLNGNVTITGTLQFTEGFYPSAGVSINYISGTIITAGSTLKLGNGYGGVVLDTNGVTWNNITILTGGTVTLSSALQMSGVLTTSTGVLACGANNVTIGGNLVNTATTSITTSGSQTFIFDGTTTISNDLNLINMTINAGKTVTITAGKTVTVSGTFAPNGTSGSHVILQSDTPSSVAYFYPATLGTVTYVDATDIDSSGYGLVNQVPTMTSTTAPAGTVSRSADGGYGSASWKAFDKVISGDNCWSPGSGTTGWLQFAFDNGLSAKVISSYTIYSPGAGWGKVSAWTLLGSNTGAFGGEETTLDTQTGQSTYPKIYTISSPASFVYYRLNVTDGASWVSILELYLNTNNPITTTGGSATFWRSSTPPSSLTT
jgi:hypothetical protein